MRGKFLLLFIGVVFAIVLLNGRRIITLSENEPESAPIQATIDDEPNKESQLESVERSPAENGKTEAYKDRSADRELHNWLDERSNSFSSFSEADQKQLKEKLAELEPADLDELKEISGSAQIPINKRILSLYMLGESTAGEMALKEFLADEIDLVENAKPHSMDESKNGREKALRVMAIEQLIERASSPEEAKAKLDQIIPTIKDPWLRSYALRKSKEIL